MATMDKDDTNRRDFLYIATGAVGLTGAALTAWPLIDQMNPDASVKALSSVEMDLAPIEEGQSVTINWRGNPVFIRHRTAKEIEESKSVPMDQLPDPIARNGNVAGEVPATDENRTLGEAGEWLVQMGVCTHLGCVPIGDGAGDFGGWFCPCHGSHYDTAGRIRKGPAPENLPVPLAEFVDETTIKLG